MAGSRQPTDVVLANGRKHMTKAEEADRRSHEISLQPAKKAIPPKWLGRGFDDDAAKALKTEFRKLGKQLIDVGLYADLDADTLAHYLVARHQWETAAAYAEQYLQSGEVKEADVWGKIQERYFSAARRCASDMGLTLSSRCKLIVPPAMLTHDDDDADEFTRALRARQQAAGIA